MGVGGVERQDFFLEAAVSSDRHSIEVPSAFVILTRIILVRMTYSIPKEADAFYWDRAFSNGGRNPI